MSRVGVTSALRAARARAAALSAEVYVGQYDQNADLRSLLRAVLAARKAVALTAPDAEGYPERLSRLGDTLGMTFDATGHRDLLDEAIVTLRRAVLIAGPGHPGAAKARASLARALMNSFRSGWLAEHLDEAIVLMDAALAEFPADDPEVPLTLSNLAHAHSLRFMRDGDVGDLKADAARLREAVAATPADDPRYVLRSAKYAAALAKAADQPGTADELRRVLEVVRRELPDLPAAMRREVLLLAEPLLTGDVTQLDGEQLARARELASAYREEGPHGQDLRAAMFSLYGTVNYTKAIESGDIQRVDEAITMLRAALAEMPPSSPDRPGMLTSLGRLLGQKIEWTSNRAVMEEMITILREAVAAVPRDSQDRGLYLANLGNGLSLKYALAGGDDLLDEVVDTYRRAVELTPAAHPRRPIALTGLATALFSRFGRWSRLADLDGAVDNHRAACAAVPQADDDRPLYLANLGGALARRSEATGSLADLDEAVQVMRDAVRLTPDAHPDRGFRMANLAVALMFRYQRTGQSRALAEAVTTLREARRISPPGAIHRSMILNNLGIALLRQDTADAREEAIAVFREAQDSAPAGSGDRRRAATNLARALIVRLGWQQDDDVQMYVRKLAMLGAAGTADLDALKGMAERFTAARTRQNVERLDQVVELLERTLRESPEEEAQRSEAVASLGTVLRLRSQLSGRDRDLDQAVGFLRAAVDSSPPGSPSLAVARSLLAAALADRWKRTDDIRSRDEAAEQFRQAVTVETAAPQWRADTAKDWAEFVADGIGPAAAVEAFATAVGLLDAAAWRGLCREDQERILSEHQGLASNAAACAIAAGDLERAVELLEQGRGVLLAQVLDARPDRDKLQRIAPLLAARLTELQDALDLPEPTEGDTDFLDRRHILARRREETLAEIRALSGLSDFLLPPPFARLGAASLSGTVVIVNVSRYRCDALAITAARVELIPLPGMSADMVTEVTESFINALHAFAHNDDPGQAEADRVSDTLRWLEVNLGAPIRSVLGLRPSTGQPWHRIWWCPTGPLALLPLHAVVLDAVVSSYTPTLRALLHARSRADPPSGGRPLLVAMPVTPGETDLPGTEQEIEAVQSLLPGAMSLVGARATRNAVLKELTSSPWAHFACHAAQDPAAPSRGRLLLYDGPLTIREIAAARLDQAEFAFLSGCETARGGDVLADECISLAATIQLAGYPHVIGALWPISDLDAPDVVRDVYDAMTGHGTHSLDASTAALALHLAVRTLRDRPPATPLLWAPFTHIGP